jgi:ubiquinone/menaquinone biosynthesis C-methylase UbiE
VRDVIHLQGHINAFVGRQQRCPTGLAGWAIGERMARQHAVETLWTIGLLDIAPTDRVLDIGCGVGRAIDLIAARVPQGHVSGVDLSQAMVRASCRRNATAIQAGRVDVRQGDVASLPHADQHFDKIVSIHTLYFWTEPERTVAEIWRVLKPGGQLALTLSPGKIEAQDDAGYRAMVDGRILPGMRRAGFAISNVEHGPDSRRYRTVAVMGVK